MYKLVKGVGVATSITMVVATAGCTRAKQAFNAASLGYIVTKGGQLYIKLKSLAQENEGEMLQEFAQIVTQFYKAKKGKAWLCAHNGKEFDFPYIARRTLINGVALPAALRVQGQKPWETTFVDTMELWRFGDYKNFTSLNLMAHIFGIPTSKDDIDGSQVATVYYAQNDLPRITVYCEKDVLTLARVYLKIRGELRPLERAANHSLQTKQ
ncbi:hypothetical protein FACS1894156_6270 [Bacteroidia bacterium]|nr:hypothetical protein FACS1894156_6270 [Bacteroidia bacterium]